MNKSLKKVVCGALASVMLLGTAPMARAATPFTDVPSDSWYVNFVDYAYNHKLMAGTSDTTFAPNQMMTRGMLATVIYSIAGKPAPSKQSPFTDIGNTWYTKAVNWCYGEGIVAGITNTTFAPNHHVTREQMAVIMRQYAKYMGRDVSGGVSLNGYADSDKIHTYAVDDMQWAVSVGLMTGMSANTIAPRHNTTRAQCAVVLQRFTEWLDEDTAEPQPTEPAPTEPKPTEPKPTEPTPTEPPAYYHDWHFVEEQGHNEVVTEAYDETVTETVYEWHIICNGCHMDFGNGPDADNDAIIHISDDFLDNCQGYHEEEIPVEHETTIQHEAVTQWVIDAPAHWKCSACGDAVNGNRNNEPSRNGCTP